MLADRWLDCEGAESEGLKSLGASDRSRCVRGDRVQAGLSEGNTEWRARWKMAIT